MICTRVAIAGIEGNSFLRFIDVDVAVLVANEITAKIKGSTRWAFQKASALYLSDRSDLTNRSKEIVTQLNTRFIPLDLKHNVPAYGTSDFPKLVAQVSRIHSARRHESQNQGS